MLRRAELVNAAWHALVLDTFTYGQFCTALGNQMIHYNPYGASDADQVQRYARTLALYRSIFHQDPPPAFWPPGPESEQQSGQKRAALPAVPSDVPQVCLLPPSACARTLC